MDRADVALLPPVVLAASLGAGVAAGISFPVEPMPSHLAHPLGILAIAMSVGVVSLAFRDMKRARTAFDVRKPTSTLVTTGIFAATRNPVYLSMFLLHVGVALSIDSLWTLLFAIPTASALCILAIRPEERYLERKFGDAYRAYRRKTPRWL
jgi:protein-S-isoprenylcysteine O-methyltransferase Ste14